MNILKRTERLARKMKWYDFSLLKLSVLFFTLFLITASPDFRDFVMGIGWKWYLGLGILFALPLWNKMFSR